FGNHATGRGLSIEQHVKNILDEYIGAIDVDGNSIQLTVTIRDGINPDKYRSINIGTLGVRDDVNNIGFRYADNYSANGKNYDRWVPDWGAVKSVSGYDILFGSSDPVVTPDNSKSIYFD